eukprot:206307-Chlamydomonas_euryale.AAC.10
MVGIQSGLRCPGQSWALADVQQPQRQPLGGRGFGVYKDAAGSTNRRGCKPASRGHLHARGVSTCSGYAQLRRLSVIDGVGPPPLAVL